MEKLICREAYEVSTLHHDHRVLIEARPRRLGEHLGYRLFMDEYLHGERQQAPTIEVIANRGVRLSTVVISVSALNEKVCYQDQVVLRHVDERRHRSALSAVPFRRLKIEGHRVYTPYDTLRIELLETRDAAGGDVSPQRPVVHDVHPIDRLAVALGQERDYVEKWGRVYNLRFLEMEIKEELIRIRAWQFHRSVVVRRCAKWLQHRTVAKLLFWAKNAFEARTLRRELNRHMAQYREFQALQQEREEATAKV